MCNEINIKQFPQKQKRAYLLNVNIKNLKLASYALIYFQLKITSLARNFCLVGSIWPAGSMLFTPALIRQDQTLDDQSLRNYSSYNHQINAILKFWEVCFFKVNLVFSTVYLHITFSCCLAPQVELSYKQINSVKRSHTLKKLLFVSSYRLLCSVKYAFTNIT